MPEGCVVDTDILSYLFRKDTRAELYRPLLTGRILAISFMTVAELDRWMLQRNWGATRQRQLAAFLEQFTIVLADRNLCRTWAEVGDRAAQRAHDSHGRCVDCSDGARARCVTGDEQ